MQEIFERELTTLDKLLGTVGDAMSHDLLLLEPRMKGSQAVRRLTKGGVTGAPVVEHGRIVGVLSLSDLTEPGEPAWQTHGPFLRHEHTLADVEVGDIMTREVITADPMWPLTHAAMVMEAIGINRLPVVDALERPIGILTRGDIVRAVARRGELAQHPGFEASFDPS
jgi:CBS domain-containing protein